MKHLIKILLITLFMSSTVSANESYRFWLAGKFLDKIYTNYDVQQYVERAVLDDAQRGQLFKLAEGDYNKYKALVRKHTASSFEGALRVLMYNKVLEYHATSGKNVKDWKAFKISPNDFHKRIQKLEDEVLKPLLDKRLGIVKARDQFGAYLIKQNFPHKTGESNTDVYFRWYKDQKFRLKHELRSQEAQKYVAIASMGHRKEIYIRPTEQNDFYKGNKRKIETELDGQMMNQSQVSDFIKKNPTLRLLIKDVHYLGLNTAPLARMLDESEERFEKAKKQAIDGIAPSLVDSKINKIASYEALAAKIAKKYNNSEKLLEKKKEASSKFLTTGDYKDAMKARIYDLAASLLDLKADRSNIVGDLSVSLRLAFDDLKKDLEKKESYLGVKTKKLLFEDIVSYYMKESFKKNLGDKYIGYLAKVLNLGAWVIEFDAKKISFNAETEVSVELKPYMNFDTQKKIQDHLKMEEFKRLMKDFTERKLRYDTEGFFSIDIDGNNQLTGVNAFDWLIKK